MATRPFVNWAGNLRYTPAHFHEPTTADEIVRLVAQHRKVALTGTGHSWSPLCVGDEALIATHRFNGIRDLDPEKGLVTVDAGVKLWELNAWLHQRGFGLTNLGSITAQAAVAAMATGTHGTGMKFQVLASQLQSFLLLQADGTRVRIDRDRDADLFALAAVNLGCLGVVLEATIRVVPAFRLHEQTDVLDFEDAMARLDADIAGTDHFKFWWFPHTDKILRYRHQRTQEAANDSRARQWLMDELVSVYAYRTLLAVGHLNPPWRRRINKLLINSLVKPLDRIERSDRVFSVPAPPIHRETEWAFDVKHTAEILRAYRDWVEKSDHHLNFIQEVRFTRADDFALSASHQRDSVWIGAYNIDEAKWPTLLADFEKFARAHDGRPHWGKEFAPDPAYLAKCYPRLGDFQALRAKLDPTGKFYTAHHARLLG
jgi:L-gulonolactone oxidase